MKMFLISIVLVVTGIADAQLIPTTPQQKIAAQISQQATMMSQQITSGMIQLYNAIWKNPNKALTPCVVWEALGTNAGQARGLFLAEAQIINGAVPNSVPAEPAAGVGTTLTQNADGSISCQ
jgi:hypothetical protein